MSDLPVKTVIQSTLTLLEEAYLGPPDPPETWFSDDEADSGILGIIARVSADQASRSVDGTGARGSTIAANVEHLRWSLANANGALQGAPYRTDWHTSWDLIQSDPAAWDELRAGLRKEFDTLCSLLKTQQDLPGAYLNGVLALVPHAAFHLGLIRQMLERVHALEKKT